MAADPLPLHTIGVSGWLLVPGDAVPPHDLWLSAQEKAILAGLTVPKRRQDWRLGRWAAKTLAVEMLEHAMLEPLLNEQPDSLSVSPSPLAASRASGAQGTPSSSRVLSLSRLSVLAAPDGAPELALDGRPLSLGLSLSHSSGLAAALLAPHGAAAGVDLETIELRAAAFLQDYFDSAEQTWAQQQPDPALAGTLLWSAKEAVLKVRRSGLREDPLAIQVRLLPPPPLLTRQLLLQPFRPASPEAPRPSGTWWAYHAASRLAYAGEWYRLDRRVLTLVTGTGLLQHP